MGSCHTQSSRNCSRSETSSEKKFWPIFSIFIFYWYGMLINIFNDKYPITRVCIYWIIQHIGICNWWPHYCKSVTPWHEKNKRKIYDRRYIYKDKYSSHFYCNPCHPNYHCLLLFHREKRSSVSINDNPWRLFWRVYRTTIQSNDGNMMWIFCRQGNKGYIFIHESLARNRKQTIIN